MANVVTNYETRREVVVSAPIAHAYEVLHWGFVALPVIAGADKFLNLLVTWDQYLAPAIARILPFSARTFMMAVGVVEILAALVVAVKPRIGGYVVAAWLAAIVVNLLVAGFYDIALRDFGLMLGAIALGRLADGFDPRHIVRRRAYPNIGR